MLKSPRVRLLKSAGNVPIQLGSRKLKKSCSGILDTCEVYLQNH